METANAVPERELAFDDPPGRRGYLASYRNSNNLSVGVLRFDSRLARSIPATVNGGSNLRNRGGCKKALFEGDNI